jgi:hypothetical protein
MVTVPPEETTTGVATQPEQAVSVALPTEVDGCA